MVPPSTSGAMGDTMTSSIMNDVLSTDSKVQSRPIYGFSSSTANYASGNYQVFSSDQQRHQGQPGMHERDYMSGMHDSADAFSMNAFQPSFPFGQDMLQSFSLAECYRYAMAISTSLM